MTSPQPSYCSIACSAGRACWARSRGQRSVHRARFRRDFAGLTVMNLLTSFTASISSWFSPRGSASAPDHSEDTNGQLRGHPGPKSKRAKAVRWKSTSTDMTGSPPSSESRIWPIFSTYETLQTLAPVGQSQPDFSVPKNGNARSSDTSRAKVGAVFPWALLAEIDKIHNTKRVLGSVFLLCFCGLVEDLPGFEKLHVGRPVSCVWVHRGNRVAAGGAPRLRLLASRLSSAARQRVAKPSVALADPFSREKTHSGRRKPKRSHDPGQLQKKRSLQRIARELRRENGVGGQLQDHKGVL